MSALRDSHRGHERGTGDPFSERRTGLDHLAFSVGAAEIEPNL